MDNNYIELNKKECALSKIGRFFLERQILDEKEKILYEKKELQQKLELYREKLKELELKKVEKCNSISALTDNDIMILVHNSLCIASKFKNGVYVELETLTKDPCLKEYFERSNDRSSHLEIVEQMTRVIEKLTKDGILVKDFVAKKYFYNYNKEMPDKYVLLYISMEELAEMLQNDFFNIIEIYKKRKEKSRKNSIINEIAGIYKLSFFIVNKACDILINAGVLKLKEIPSGYYSIPQPIECIVRGHGKYKALVRIERDTTCQKNITEMRLIDEMEGHQFEYYCADLLRKLGFYNVEVTKGSGDQGVDIIAINEDGVRYAVQCKCYSSSLDNTPVQEISAGKQLYNCHVGVVMTNQYFTTGAKDLAKATNVLLWDRNELQKMIEKANLQKNNISDID